MGGMSAWMKTYYVGIDLLSEEKSGDDRYSDG